MVMEKIGNKNDQSSFHLACMICKNKQNLHTIAHRNKEDNITGFLIACDKKECMKQLTNADLGIINR